MKVRTGFVGVKINPDDVVSVEDLGPVGAKLRFHDI